jgi:glycosyltransferase involved in cell wall biosynthesis
VINNKNTLVSAIITTHNRAELLKRALDSVIGQTYPNVEIVVVDDGSVDDTRKVIRRYQQQYEIVYLRNRKSKGAPAARNYGIQDKCF